MKLKALLFVKLLSSKHFSYFFCLFIRAFLTGYWLKSNMMEKRFDLLSVNCCIALVLRASLRMLGVFMQLVWFIGSVFVVFCYALKEDTTTLNSFPHDSSYKET